MKLDKFIATAIILGGFAIAQEKKADPAINAETKVEVLEAQHQLDDVTTREKDAQIQIQQFVAQLQKQKQEAQDKFDAALLKVYAEAGKTKEKYDLNINTWTFTPKPEPKKQESKK